MKLVWIASVCCAFILPASGQRLPVFLADNHAESFAWIARTFDPDAPLLLLLVDEHTDATAAERSEEIREQLRRVTNLTERVARSESWRVSGRLQAFNWIEPLMPRPIEQVLWVPKVELTEAEAAQRTSEAVAALDGRLEVEPRGAGSFAGRWRTIPARALEQWEPAARQRIVLSIDLDFFAGMNAVKQQEELERIWRRAMNWPGLAGVSFSVSRPWLRSDAEADFLVRLATGLVVRTRGADLEIDASLDDRPDDSLRATELPIAPPRWDAAAASLELQTLWANLGARLRMTDRKRHWEERKNAVRIVADTGEIDCDEVWRFDLLEAPVLRVHGASHGTGRVRWFELRSARKAYDFIPETRLGKDFSDSPGRWVYEERHALGETLDFALPPAAWLPGGPGRVRIEAEVDTPQGWLPVPPIEIRLLEGTGFRRALSETLRMPYGFGIAMLVEGELEAVETGWAADCSNALIHAFRRGGVPMRWGDPGILRGQLEPLPAGTSISQEMIERGLVVDFGRHVAAVWEDREPFGVLDGGDLMYHHLGDYPEIVTLAELSKTRPTHTVRALPKAKHQIALKLAGDVVLADEDRIVVEGFEKGGADLFLVNLEGIPSMLEPEVRPRYDFRFPSERLTWLRKSGVDAVSLANNHAGDAGLDGLMEGMAALRQAGIGFFGAGANETEACRPWQAKVHGKAVAIFGVCIVDGRIAGPDTPGIAHLPTHQRQLEAALHEAKASGAIVVVLMHGGDEYRTAVNASQGQWARWLVRRGARVIAGAHPHVLQKRETHGGAAVFHSLGNAVYPSNFGRKGGGVVDQFIVDE